MQIVWQPVLDKPREEIMDSYGDLTIHLDITFARKLMAREIKTTNMQRFQEIGRDILKTYKFHEPNPYNFFEESLLVNGIYIDRGNGKWLVSPRTEVKSLDRKNSPLQYHAHNFDTIFDERATLALFSKWIHYCNVFLEDPSF